MVWGELGHVQCIVLGCCLIALARFGWSNLSLDDVLLERQSLLQEAVSSTLKVKIEEKRWEGKIETKAAFKEERKYHGLDQYSSHLLLHLLFRFVLTWESSIPLPPLLIPLGHVQWYASGCCLAALARFRWSNLRLDDILLGRHSLL
jgi:hypothetical protein